MKKLTLFYSLVLLLFNYNQLVAQGIPIKYKAKVIQFRSPYKEIMLDFLDKDGEFNKVVPIESGFRITDKSGKPSNVDEISPGSDIELIGENINYKDKYNELRITKKYIGEDVELSGIIEFKNNETGISIIDGQSMQLSPGTAIKGESKLKGQKYTSIKEISLGNFMNCKGTRRKDGTIEVTSASVKENMHDITDDELRKSLGDEFSFKNLTAISIPANLKSKYSGNTTDTLKGGYVEFGGVTRFRLLDNIDVQAYVSNIGFKLLPQWVKDIPSDVPEKINFKFYVLENPIFNAFALPNGMVFVNSGLLSQLDNEAQLAAVIGHEIGHATNEHAKQRYLKQKKMNGAADFGQVVLAISQKQDKASNNDVAKFLTADEGKGSTSIADMEKALTNLPPQTKTALVGLYTGVKGIANGEFSKDNELQADRVGLVYMEKAGYDPREAANLWKKFMELTDNKSILERMTKTAKDWLTSSSLYKGMNPLVSAGDFLVGKMSEKVLDNWFSSHPKAKERYRNLNQLIATNYNEADFSKMILNADPYNEMKQSLNHKKDISTKKEEAQIELSNQLVPKKEAQKKSSQKKKRK